VFQLIIILLNGTLQPTCIKDYLLLNIIIHIVYKLIIKITMAYKYTNFFY